MFFFLIYLQHNNIHEEQNQLITIQHTIQKLLTKRKYVYICINITTIKTRGGGGGGAVPNKQKSSLQVSIAIQFSSVILLSWVS